MVETKKKVLELVSDCLIVKVDVEKNQVRFAEGEKCDLKNKDKAAFMDALRKIMRDKDSTVVWAEELQPQHVDQLLGEQAETGGADEKVVDPACRREVKK